MPNKLAPTEEIIAELRAGKMVILVDEEDRENEGDLVLAADHVTAEEVNFMAKHGRGLICLTLTRERCQQLNLPLMVRDNKAPHGTAPGTSLCYKRSTWERKPFSDLPRIIAGKNVGDSEDVAWLRGLNIATVPSLYPNAICEPRLIASIHGGNTMPYDDLESSTSWRRTPQFDSFCRERMVL